MPGANGVREKDGRPLKLTMIVGFPSAEDHRSMPEFVQAQLRDVGIEVEIVQTPDTATYETRLAAGEGDLWAERGSQNDGNPCFLPDLLFSTPLPEGDPEAAMYGAPSRLERPSTSSSGNVEKPRRSRRCKRLPPRPCRW